MQHSFFQFLWHRVGDGKWSFLMTLNGALAGMVGRVNNFLFHILLIIIILMINMIMTITTTTISSIQAAHCAGFNV